MEVNAQKVAVPGKVPASGERVSTGTTTIWIYSKQCHGLPVFWGCDGGYHVRCSLLGPIERCQARLCAQERCQALYQAGCTGWVWMKEATCTAEVPVSRSD